MAYLADSKLYRTMDMPDAHSFLQNDLDSLNNCMEPGLVYGVQPN